MAMATTKQVEEVNWDRLDKKKLAYLGAGMFSGVTVLLFPLTVLKTKQMTLPDVDPGFQGAKQTAKYIWRQEGVPGFYRGFSTVLFGALPSRMVYLGVLEWSKSEVGKALASTSLAEPARAGVANFVAGAVASLVVQSVTVPIDVISQKQMVHGDETVMARQQHRHVSSPAADSSSAAARSGAESSSAAAARPAAQAAASKRIGALQLIRMIVKEEGLSGLYRGFGVSVATFVPSSAVWWASYGAYQKVIWGAVQSMTTLPVQAAAAAAPASSSGAQPEPRRHSTTEVMAVQTTSSVLAGCTSSLVTTPLDLIKTRIQVSYRHDGMTPSVMEVARQIIREDGMAGFLRGAFPRMMNASLWGTTMVSVYEFLKRVCQLPEP